MKWSRSIRATAAALIAALIASPSFSSSSSSTSSTPFEGVWVGIITQPGGPYERYILRVEIKLEGTKIVGKSRIEIPGTTWYGEMPIEGELAGDTVRYTEGWMVAENIPSEFAWCMKKATLRLIPTTDTLSSDSLIGPWNSPPCMPGQIRLGRAHGVPMTLDTGTSDGRFRPDSGKK